MPMLPLNPNNSSNLQFINNNNQNIFKNALNLSSIISLIKNNPHLFNPLFSNTQSSNFLLFLNF